MFTCDVFTHYVSVAISWLFRGPHLLGKRQCSGLFRGFSVVFFVAFSWPSFWANLMRTRPRKLFWENAPIVNPELLQIIWGQEGVWGDSAPVPLLFPWCWNNAKHSQFAHAPAIRFRTGGNTSLGVGKSNWRTLGIYPKRNTKAKCGCQKRFQVHIFGPRSFECNVLKEASGGSNCHEQCP